MSSKKLPAFISEQREPLWQEAVALICTKCFDRLPQSFQTSELMDLRSWLKERLRSDGNWDRLRVLTTGCQGICPTDQICMYLQNRNQENSDTVWILNPELNREQLYQELVRYLLP